LNELRLERIEELKNNPQKRPLEEEENGDATLPCEPSTKKRKMNIIPKTRESNGTSDHQVRWIVYVYEETLNERDQDLFDSDHRERVIKMILAGYDNIDDEKEYLDIFWNKWVKGMSDDEINNLYKKKKLKEDVLNVICKINEYVYMLKKTMNDSMSRRRLPKNPNYKDLIQRPFIHGRRNDGIWTPWDFIAPMGEIIDPIKNIDLVMDEYKKSLLNLLSISKEDFEIIRKTLINHMIKLETGEEKTKFLDKVTKILVTRELNDTSDDNDMNDIFDSFNFIY